MILDFFLTILMSDGEEGEVADRSEVGFAREGKQNIIDWIIAVYNSKQKKHLYWRDNQFVWYQLENRKFITST